MKKTYAVIGATGNTGRPIAESLLKAGNDVRIIVRDAAKAKPLTDKGAQLFQGEANDAALLQRAFTGADAVYVMVPPNYQAQDMRAHQRASVDAIATALKANGVKHAVCLSSVGAHRAEGTGAIGGLHYMEQQLGAIDGLNVRFVRAAFFMENLLNMAGMAKHMGLIGSPMRGDIKFDTVATKDIAARATERLSALDFTGKSHEYVLGPSAHSYNEIASVLGKSIGKEDLRYKEFPYEAAAQSMTQMGMSLSAAEAMNGISRGMNEGVIAEEVKRTPESTTPTTLHEFVSTWKRAYEQN
jgi:uncharacterized protein YbjT (DUF2867 family)